MAIATSNLLPLKESRSHLTGSIENLLLWGNETSIPIASVLRMRGRNIAVGAGCCYKAFRLLPLQRGICVFPLPFQRVG